MSDSQPIILDGGDEMVNVHLPASFQLPDSFKEETREGEKFSLCTVTPEPKGAHFTRIVIKDEKGLPVLNQALPVERWTIEIK